ncbi:threonylcarbamoyl-AMP synthase [Vibrio sp. MACH09]|nr:threonylcarbamoyl-AMP synthase [Vibrio sp. MACH09]
MNRLIMNMENVDKAVQALEVGRVIAYPTEGVFGVGCDPDNIDAIKELLAIKQRPVEKGLILIASSYQQLRPYVDERSLTAEQLEQIKQSWPAAITWVMPASDLVSPFVSGQFNTVAVRVTDHPTVKALCDAFGKPITSTSANLTGMVPCMTTNEVYQQLGQTSVVIVEGETGGRSKPSEIRDAKTLTILREG